MKVGAAVLGVPVKPTIKEVSTGNKVVRTINRANLWEVQTPQVVRSKDFLLNARALDKALWEEASTVVDFLTVAPSSFTSMPVDVPY